MPLISFHCRKCDATTHHKIVDFNEESEHLNYAKLKCIKCPEDSFVVEYPKQTNAPTSRSRRVNEVVGGEEV